MPHIRFPSAHFLRAAAVAAGLSVSSGTTALAAGYEADLGPSPYDDGTKALMTGHGAATATLAGNKLTIEGKFEGLASAATGAHLNAGIAIGAPGPRIFDLTATQADGGTLAGTFTLDSKALAALRSGRVYIQIDSQKVAGPYGNLWGWLLPDYEKAAEGVPQEGHWFLPQLDLPKK